MRRPARAASAGVLALLLASRAVAQSATAIEGHVVDAMGQPVAGAVVRAAEVRFHDGRRRLVARPPAVTSSDDRGAYRFEGLTTGRYRLSATADPPEPQVPTPFGLAWFLPNPTAAVEISIEAGHRVTADLSTAHLPTAHVAGRMVNAAGRAITGPLFLEPSARSGATTIEPKGATIFPDGRFEFENVPPGEYTIKLVKTRLNPSAEGEFAGAYVSVSGADVGGLELNATVGSTIKGKVTFADDEPIPQGRFVVAPARADLDQTPFIEGDLAHGDVQLDQTFEIRGLHGPRRLLLAEAPAGWTLKAVRVKGEDVTDMPLAFGTPKESLDDVEIVVTSRTSAMTGFALDERGARAMNYSLLVFPVDRAMWYPESRFFRHVDADAEGRFDVKAMPPADYFVAAVTLFDARDDGWQDPEVLEKLSLRATRVTVDPAARVAVTAPLLR